MDGTLVAACRAGAGGDGHAAQFVTGTMGRQLGYALSRWLPDHVTAVSQATAESHMAAGMVRESRSVSVAERESTLDLAAGSHAQCELRRVELA